MASEPQKVKTKERKDIEACSENVAGAHKRQKGPFRMKEGGIHKKDGKGYVA